jgi:hypothetical protein
VHGAAYRAYGLIEKAYRRIILGRKASAAARENPQASGDDFMPQGSAILMSELLQSNWEARVAIRQQQG